jgi:cytoskeleton protein RodZ
VSALDEPGVARPERSAAASAAAPGGPEEATAGGTASPGGLVAVASRPPAKVLPASPAVLAANAAAPRGQIAVVLTYSGDSWTEIYDATGRRLLYGLSTGAATRRVAGVAPLSVLLGDASGVTLEVGGRATSFARFTHADHIARFMIAADGRVLAAPRKTGG